jgi:transposase
MKHCAGLDVSLKETAICIVDEAGKVVRETKVATEPEAVIAFLNGGGVEYARVGLEAGPLSQWLVNGLAEAGLPVICVETRHMKAILKAQQVNKSDRNDARGIAQMMRVGLYKPVHVKTLASQQQRMLLASQQQRMLLTSRKLLRDKLQDIENELRGTLRNFGLKVGVVSSGQFEARIKELVAGQPPLEMIVTPLLAVRRVVREQLAKLDKMVLDQVRGDKLCRRLMTVPGVGPIVALTFRATVDQAQRFARSKTVGAHFGLAPRRFQSGERDYDGRVSKCGDAMMRTALYEAAQVLLTRTQTWSWLKAWGMQVARRRGAKKAIVALARRLAVVMHRMWIDGTEFRWRKEADTAAT